MSPGDRTVSREASAVFEHVAAAKRRTISLPGDGDWLSAVTPHYVRLLDRMAVRKLLYRIRRGQYVVAPWATSDVDQAVPVELLVDLALREQGPYYLGFLSALIAHRLTDLHSSTLYAAVRQGSPTDLTSASLAGHELKLVRLSGSRWPREDNERERVRVQTGLKEFVWRSSLERTLVDGILRPELCGGIETIVTGWARARDEERADWSTVWAIARRTSSSTARRVAFLLIGLGYEHVVADELRTIGKQKAIPLDRCAGYDMPRGQMPRDRQTGVLVNVPPRQLRGWLGTVAVG
jgi:predicted transcriptional regulator of viral defense system